MTSPLRHLAARLRALVRGADLDRDFSQELASHLEMMTEDNICRGLSPAEARRQASVRLGAASSLHSQHRDARGFRVLEDLFQDLRFATRLMIKDRWFSATVTMVLALGIGANTVGFTIVNAAFFRGLPFDHAAQLHMVSFINQKHRRVGPLPSEFDQWRDSSRAFADLAGYDDTSASLSDTHGVPDQVRATRVTTNTFALLRQAPVLGRDFVAADAAPSAMRVVLLGHHVWKNRYGANPQVLGATIRIDAVAATVIGVMPEGMRFPDQSDIWVPLVRTAGEEPRLEVIGRLRDDAGKPFAQSEFDGIVRSQQSADPQRYTEIIGARVETVPEYAIGGIGRRLFLIIMSVVMFVLLIAGANVANLLLLRSATRAREMALRVAMGATRWRLVRQLLIESLVLSLAGAALGIALAQGGVLAFAAAMRNGGLPFWVVFSIDYRVVSYAVALAMVVAVVFGLVPALQAASANSSDVIKDGGRGSVGSPRVRRFGAAMVVLELSVAIALLGGAGLLFRSFATLSSVDLGVNIAPLVTMSVELPASRYPTADDRRAFVARLEPRLAAVPGVQGAAITTGVPSRDGGERTIEIEGQAVDAPRLMVSTVTITPRFFDAIDLPMRQGRGFTESDGAFGSETAIVNAQFAGKFFAGQNPVGRRLRFIANGRVAADSPDVWRTIVGVAPNVSHGSPSDQYLNAAVYLPYREAAPQSVSILVRSTMPPESIMGAVQREARALDPDLPITALRTVANLLDEDRWLYRTFGAMFAAFAVIAVALSAAALYAVVSHSVRERMPEFGVRVTLGASRGAIVRLVLERGLRQLSVGITLGLGGALVLGDVLSGMLVGVSATDPLTLTVITLILTTVSIAACLRPALKAGHVNPITALRAE